MNASADSFYSSQGKLNLTLSTGRIDLSFIDSNDNIVDSLVNLGVCTLDMESSMLMHLATCVSAKRRGPIRAAACAMVFANRISGDFITQDTIKALEAEAGQAVLEAIVSRIKSSL
jgi:uridine phosphorylase